MKHLRKFNESNDLGTRGIKERDADKLQDDIIEDTKDSLVYLMDNDWDFVSHRFYDPYKKYSTTRDVYFNCIRLTMGCVRPILHGGNKRVATNTSNYHIGYSLLNPNGGEIAQGNWGIGRNSNQIEVSNWFDVKDTIITYVDRMTRRYNLVYIEFETERGPEEIENSDFLIKQLELMDDFSFDTITFIFTI
jgi:hypothetical protein